MIDVPEIWKRTINATVIQMFVHSGVAPVVWKKANVIPLSMKGGKETPGTYWPVGLTSVLEKLMQFNFVFIITCCKYMLDFSDISKDT